MKKAQQTDEEAFQDIESGGTKLPAWSRNKPPQFYPSDNNNNDNNSNNNATVKTGKKK